MKFKRNPFYILVDNRKYNIWCFHSPYINVQIERKLKICPYKIFLSHFLYLPTVKLGFLFFFLYLIQNDPVAWREALAAAPTRRDADHASDTIGINCVWVPTQLLIRGKIKSVHALLTFCNSVHLGSFMLFIFLALLTIRYYFLMKIW